MTENIPQEDAVAPSDSPDRAAVLESFLAQFAEDPESAPEAAEETVEVQAEVKPPEPVADPTEAEPEARGYRRLLARESKFREDKAAFDKEKAALEAEVQAYRAVKSKLKAEPLAYLRAAGLSQSEIMAMAKKAHYEDLGDLAPPEIKTVLEAQKYADQARAEREAMEAKLAERDSQQLSQKQQADMAAYQQAAFQHVNTSLDAHPRIARFISTGRGSDVSAALMAEAQDLAASMDPNGPPPAFADVAKSLEARLDALVNALTATTPPVPVAAAEPPVAAPGKPVLRNAATSAQPTSAPTPEPKDYAEMAEQLRKKALAKYGITR